MIGLVFVNGALLALGRSTRRIGIGAMIAAVASVPPGFFALLMGMASMLGDS